jgi:hypothetical protein
MITARGRLQRPQGILSPTDDKRSLLELLPAEFERLQPVSGGNQSI